jgi:hypothetical protein
MCISLGCGVSYNVGVNAYSSSGRSLQIHPESSINIVADVNTPNPILAKEIGMKIRTLLNEKGYSIGTDQADYYLRFDYGMNSGQTITDIIPIYRRAYYGYPFSSVYSHGYTTYLPYSTVVYTRWLVLKLIDGRAYSALHEAEPLWISEVTSAGPGTDLRELINYMLIAAFEHFGEDTGKRLNQLFLADDEKVKFLKESWKKQ